MDTISNANNFVSWFRQSSPYIHAHRGKTFVVMLPGDVMGEASEQNHLTPIVHDLALLNALGIKLVLVSGARTQIDGMIASRDIEPGFHNTKRITDQATLLAAIDASGRNRTQLEAAFSAGLPNTPLHGASIKLSSGNFVHAKPYGIVDGVDHLHTGDIRKIDIEAIQAGLSQQHIMLLSCIAYSATGEAFNVQAEQVAKEAAIALQADKLVFYHDQQGLLDEQGELLRELTASQLGDFKSHVSRSTNAMLNAIKEASAKGVQRTHIVSFKNDGALLKELFSRDGVGTLVTPAPYEQVRAANIDDVGGILELIEPLEAAGTLVKRSRELLEHEIEQFHVIDRDGSIIACAALYPHSDEHIGECACIVVHPEYRQSKRAQTLMKAVYQKARELKLNKVFVLTTQTAHWFLEQGYIEAEISALPAQKQAFYNFQRNSKVFIKAL